MTESSDEKAGEVIDRKTGRPDDTPTPGQHRRIDLSNLRDVRLEMAAVYRMVNARKLESQDGSRRVYMLRQIADVIAQAEFERRISELEDQAALSSRLGLPQPERTFN